MSNEDKKHRSHLPMRNTVPARFIPYDAKDPDMVKTPIEQLRPPEGAPNVLIILIDDCGFGAPSTFGGPCATPTADRLAAGGLKFNRFHTTAICSATRQALLTGRNHHNAGMAGITEIATGQPGYSSVLPNTMSPLAKTLKLNGYSTAQFGKCHEVPVWQSSQVGPFDQWPTGGGGFEYFYGFIGGEAHQWYPSLVEGTTPIEAPKTPEQGYHLVEDMTDKAIGWIQQQKALAPDKPFFAYFAPGATHAPHHVAKEWADKYKGKFDAGWDKLREEIAAPDKVETRLGTLAFFDGFPNKATVEKIYDNLDFQRAVQAYLLAMAPVNMVGLRQGLLGVGPANVTIPTFEANMNARSIFLTANATTPYTWIWIDLHEGPLVVEVPPMTLGMIDDFWFRYVTDIGVVGPDKGKGGKYLLLPPGYDGDVPEGYIVVRVPTFESILVWRNMPLEGGLKAAIERLHKNTRIYSLSQTKNPPANTFVNVSDRDFCTVAVADYKFWEFLNYVVQNEPVESCDPVTLGFYASIGIEKGKPFAPDARMKKILTEAAAVGDATVRTLTYQSRIPEAFYYPNSTWRQWLGGYQFQSQPGVAYLDMAAFFYFYATGVTPAMEAKMVGKGSQYAVGIVDSKGNPLDGGKTYKLHVLPNAPAKDFWSAIVYDNQTRSMLQTDQAFPQVSSQDDGLMVNKDGSVDVYFGPNAPAGMEKNWIQTVPGKGWNMLFRLYGPLEAWFDKTWRLSEIACLD